MPDDQQSAWEALLTPGGASDFFQLFSALPRLAPAAAGFSAVNACWLAEVSRIIYRAVGDDQRVERNRYFARHGLIETDYIASARAQAAIIAGRSADAYRILVFRGTHNGLDAVTDLDALLTAAAGFPGRVHGGFAAAFAEIGAAVEARLGDDPTPLFVTGHSLGAALATLFVARRGRTAPVRGLYTFGSPRIGDPAFAAAFAQLGVDSYRIRNDRDLVATLPTPPLYAHVASEIALTAAGGMAVGGAGSPAPVPTSESGAALVLSGWRGWRARMSGLLEPPQFLADHAPRNYVAKLAAAVAAGR